MTRYMTYKLVFVKTIIKLSSNRTEATIRIGLYNGFPECCCRAFACGWDGIVFSKAYPELDHIHLGYVPCPVCCENMMEELV